jgi:hypothetical protein
METIICGSALITPPGQSSNSGIQTAFLSGLYPINLSVDGQPSSSHVKMSPLARFRKRPHGNVEVVDSLLGCGYRLGLLSLHLILVILTKVQA